LYNIIQNLKEVNEGSFIQNLFNVFSLLKSSRREMGSCKSRKKGLIFLEENK